MEQIQKHDHYRRGLNDAIQFLSYRKRTEKEVRQHLSKMKFLKVQFNKL